MAKDEKSSGSKPARGRAERLPQESKAAPENFDREGISRRSFLRRGTAGALSAGLVNPSPPSPAGKGEESAVADARPVRFGPGPSVVTFRVNGEERQVSVEPRVTLLDALRDHLRVTGPKKVCDRATCGACTVLEDGVPVYACSRLAIESAGREIVTIEGLGSPEDLHPIQQAFVDHDAQQCGFCTPGFVLAVTVLLERNANPNEKEIEAALGGNLCRCGTYGGMRKVLPLLSVESG